MSCGNNEVISFQTIDSLNNSAVKDSHVAEDRKLGNMLKRGREKVKEVAEKGRSVRARVKVKWRQWLRLGRL